MSSDSQLQNSSTDLAECKRRPAKTIEDCGYLLGDTIGHGAYAKVKLARYARTGKKVKVYLVCKLRRILIAFDLGRCQGHH